MKNLAFTFIAFLLSFSAFAVVGPILGPTSVCTGGTITLTDTTAGGSWSSSNPAVGSIDPSTGVLTGIMTGATTVTYTASTGFVTIAIMISTAPGPITGPASLCTGSTITWANAIPGGTWSSSTPAIAVITPAGLIVGISAGTTTITYSLGTGCTTSRTIAVNPAPPAITGPSAVCAGDSILLSNAITGGTWNSSNPTVASISPVGFLSGVTTGVTVVTYTIGTGCATTRAITTNFTPPAITGPDAVCVGNTITMASGSGGFWSSSMPAVAAIGSGSGVVTGLATGTAIIRYYTSSGCSSVTSVMVAGLLCPGVTSGGTTTVSSTTTCGGSLVHVSVALGCDLTYQWQSSHDGTTFTDISGATNYRYNTLTPGNWYFKCKKTCPTSGLFSYSAPASVTITSSIASHTTIITPDTICHQTDFYITACSVSSSYNVTTWFGDGSSVNTPLSTTGVSSAHVLHSYDLPGTYRVKQVMYLGATPLDTLSFSYEHLYCNTLPIKLYFDANSNSILDAGEKSLLLPLRIRIDSNGVPVDTVSATSGLYYKAFGTPGTIYSFRIISLPPGLSITTPSGGILYDTIHTTVNDYHTKYFGLNCTGSTSLDLVQHVSTRTGRHTQMGTIMVSNPFCAPQDADVTLHFNPRYYLYTATPFPVTLTPTTATWHLTGIAAGVTTLPQINYHLETTGGPGAWFMPGDTVHSNYITIATGGGDIDTSNNVLTKNDTVRSSFDPNDIAVSPKGNVLPCTKLQYTIRFENDGNDTARDIYILDTLSANLDPSTLNIEIASAAMNIAIINDGVHNIVKFDFPGINLPDSSHHGLCHGMLIYNIKTKPGLADGVAIPNSAGIYFDDNPVVLTNTIQNTIGISPITGPSNVCTGSNIYLGNATENGTWSSSNALLATVGSATGIVNGIATGTPVISYSLSNSCGTRSVTHTIAVNPAPPAIAGTPVVCTGATTTLSNPSTGGTWNSGNTAVATVGAGSGIVAGISADTAVITYVLPTGCKATRTVTVNPPATPVTGTTIVCSGANTTLSNATPGGAWTSGSTSIAIVGSSTGVVAGISAGTVLVSYTLSTGCVASAAVTVNPSPAAYPVTGGGNYCAGGTGVAIGLVNSDVGTNYMLHLGATVTGPVAGTGSALGFGLLTVAGTYTVSATNTATTCQGIMPGSALIGIDPLVVPAVSITPTPGLNICVGTPVSFAPVPVNGGAAPVYIWNINGTNVATGSAYSFLPANGDIVTVTLTSNEHCASPDTTSTSVLMTVNTPIASVAITAAPGLYIVVGQSDTFTAVITGSGGPFTYQWLINGSPIPGATQPVFITSTLYNGDIVTCQVIDNGPCAGNGSASATIMLNNVGIQPVQKNSGLTIFPNPSKGSFTVKGTLQIAAGDEVTIEVANVLGQLVYKGSAVSHNGNINEQVALGSTLAPGTYMLILRTGYGKEVIPFVIEK